MVKNVNVEATANELEDPLNLLDLLEDELQELYSSIYAIKRSKTEEEQQQARNLLAFDVEQRISRMETLVMVSQQLLSTSKSELLNEYEFGKYEDDEKNEIKLQRF